MSLQKNPNCGRLWVTVHAYAKTLAAKAANNVIVQPTRHLPVIEQPRPANLDVPSSSASEGGPVSGLPNDATTQARRKGNRVLVVEDQVIASNLFMYEGYEVEKRSRTELTGTGAQDVNGRIKQSEFAPVWLTLPKGSKALPARQFSAVMRTLALWFRTAALIGTVAVLTAPKTNMWMNEHLGNLLSDNIAYESLHRCCRCTASLTPENPAPSVSSYTMYSTIPVNSSLCKCDTTTHFKDYEYIVGRSDNYARRLKVDTIMTSALWKNNKRSKMKRRRGY